MLNERGGGVGKENRPRSIRSGSDGCWTEAQGERENTVVRAGNEREVKWCCVVSQLEKFACSGIDIVSQLKLKFCKRNVV